MKWDKSVRGAIDQIKSQEYTSWIQGYTGNILLVGINYKKKEKIHECIIEEYCIRKCCTGIDNNYKLNTIIGINDWTGIFSANIIKGSEMLWNEGTIEKMICDIAACTDTRIVAVDIGGKILSASDDYWDMRSEMLLRLIARYIESQKEEVLETSVLIEEEEGSKAIKEIVVKGNTEGFSIMELPNIQSEKGLRLWREEIIRLKVYLEEKFQVVITDDDVKRAIRVENRRRSALKRLYEVMKFDPVPIMGMDLLNVLYGSKYRLDKEQAAEDINRLTDRILDEYKPDAGQKRRPRILVTDVPSEGTL